MFKTIIVDDEPLLVTDISTRIHSDFSAEIMIAATATNILEAKLAIELHRPNILFLDVHLKDGTGFDLLEQLNYKGFELIFVTGYDNNAIKAIKFGALDYILKPIDDEEFRSAVRKAISATKNSNSPPDLIHVANNFYKGKETQKIVFKTTEDLFVLNKDDIMYCESEGNYTTIHTKDNTPIMVSKNLKKVEDQLPPDCFIRCHQSFIVNKEHVRKFNSRGYLLLKNDIKIPVSVRRREETLSRIFN